MAQEVPAQAQAPVAHAQAQLHDQLVRRVKLYELDEKSGEWVDCGTGLVYWCARRATAEAQSRVADARRRWRRSTEVESLGGTCIVVYPEDGGADRKPLLQNLLSSDDIYRQQQGALRLCLRRRLHLPHIARSRVYVFFSSSLFFLFFSAAVGRALCGGAGGAAC